MTDFVFKTKQLWSDSSFVIEKNLLEWHTITDQMCYVITDFLCITIDFGYVFKKMSCDSSFINEIFLYSDSRYVLCSDRFNFFPFYDKILIYMWWLICFFFSKKFRKYWSCVFNNLHNKVTANILQLQQTFCFLLFSYIKTNKWQHNLTYIYF